MFSMFSKLYALYVFKVTKFKLEVWVNKVEAIIDLKANKNAV